MANYRTAVGRVRLVGMLEGISFLLLLGVAMPLKYIAHIPEAVKWAGWAHGALFIGLILVIFQAWGAGALSFGRCVQVFIAALLPFGPFVMDRRLEQDEERGPAAG